jgi:hypothetical protein
MAVALATVHASLKDGVALLSPGAIEFGLAPAGRCAAAQLAMTDQAGIAITVVTTGICRIVAAAGAAIAKLVIGAIPIRFAGVRFIA